MILLQVLHKGNIAIKTYLIFPPWSQKLIVAFSLRSRREQTTSSLIYCPPRKKTKYSLRPRTHEYVLPYNNKKKTPTPQTNKKKTNKKKKKTPFFFFSFFFYGVFYIVEGTEFLME